MISSHPSAELRLPFGQGWLGDGAGTGQIYLEMAVRPTIPFHLLPHISC
jgi:hypothetical protein